MSLSMHALFGEIKFIHSFFHSFEMSMKAKSIGLLYELNRFLPETIFLKRDTLHLLIHTYHIYGIEAWHGT